MSEHPIDDPYVETAVDAAERAAALQRDRFGTDLDSDYKGPRDLVTAVDRESERAIVDVIEERFPDHGIVGEEGGEHGPAESRWIIDPLDGTTNYVHGLPNFAVSIAFEEAGELRAGVVHHPLSDRTFTAASGAGAYCDGKPIEVSGRSAVEESLVATGNGPDVPPEWVDSVGALAGRAHAVRQLGSAATELALVAAGRLDAYFHYDLADWDLAAGALLVEEAGGASNASAYRGGTDVPFLASNGGLQDPLFERLVEPNESR